MGYGSVDLAWYNNNGTAIDSFLTNRILWNVSYAGDLGTGFTKWKLGLAENGLVDTGSIAPGELLLEEPDHLALVNDGQDDLFFKAEEWSDDISEECNESTITVSNLRADIFPGTKRYMAREEERPNGIEVVPLPEGAVPVIE
jgi:hypothetical protein